jgi:hypothetical protein
MDPLYRFHQWQANLRILEATDIKSIPYVPLSHPFVERLMGTLRRKYLDHTLFWTTADLEHKLLDFRTYFNNHRTHTSLRGRTPDTPASRPIAHPARFDGNLTVEPHTRHQPLPDMSKKEVMKRKGGEDVSSTGESSVDSKKADPDVASKAARGTL